MLPFFQLFGFKIPAYGVTVLLAVLTVAALSCLRGKRRGITLEDVAVLAALSILFGLFGGKLLYLLVCIPWEDMWTILSRGSDTVRQGGMVFYGGLLFGIPGCLLGMRIMQCRFSKVEETVVPLLPLGHAIGRVGCLLAGCCYGFSYNGFLAIQGRFPILLIEMAANLLISGLLFFFSQKSRKVGALLAGYLMLYGILRFALEFFRGDSIRGFYLGLSTSQWIAAITVAASLLFFLLPSWRDKMNSKNAAP